MMLKLAELKDKNVTLFQMNPADESEKAVAVGQTWRWGTNLFTVTKVDFPLMYGQPIARESIKAPESQEHLLNRDLIRFAAEMETLRGMYPVLDSLVEQYRSILRKYSIFDKVS